MAIRRFTHTVPPPRVLVAMGAVVLLLLGLVTVAGRAGAAPGDPVLTVSKTSGLDPAGETVTVSGTGFDPDAHVGTRPPLNGQPSGVYVVFGRFTEPWRPSTVPAPPSSNRAVIEQKWALGASSRALLDPTGTGAAYVTIGEDGTFSTTLTLKVDDTRSGDYAVVTYPASGAVNPAYETYQAVSFAPSSTTTTAPETTTTTAPETTTTTAPETTTTTAPSTTSTTVPTTSTTAPDGTVGVTGGYLDWGVKESFRGYVVGAGGGSISVDGGATTNGDGTFRFPVGSGRSTSDGEAFAASFGGSVRFTAHGGELDLLVSGLEVEAEGDDGVLVADVVSHELGGGDETFTDVELADLDLSGVTAGSAGLTVTWEEIVAALTEAGAPAFGGFYTAGAELDPLTVVLDLEETTVPTTTPTTTPGTGASVNGTSFVAGGRITVTADGFTPGEQVEVWLFSEPQWVGTAVAAADGSVTYTFTLPADLPAGEHHIELRGITSGRVVSTATFSVAAATAVSVGSGTLPYTGGDSVPAGVAGAALVLSGALLAVVARRRHPRLGTSA